LTRLVGKVEWLPVGKTDHPAAAWSVWRFANQLQLTMRS